MDEPNNSTLTATAGDSRLVSFADAARFLGVDTFTFYALIQREEIPTAFAPFGELMISEAALEELARKD